jgi:hypothetical protein
MHRYAQGVLGAGRLKFLLRLAFPGHPTTTYLTNPSSSVAFEIANRSAHEGSNER